MQIAGYISEDFPNPMDEVWESIAQASIPLFTLISQPSIDEYGPGLNSSSDAIGVSDMRVAFSYTVIRNPADPSDPANLAVLDETTRKALDIVPSHPVPQWMTELTERLRYPSLWEAVKTHWFRDANDRPAIDDALVEHVAHVRANSVRAQHDVEGRPGDLPAASDANTAGVQRDAVLRIDGVDHPAVQIDSDPHVYAVGAVIDDSTLVTIVIARDELPYVRLELITRASS